VSFSRRSVAVNAGEADLRTHVLASRLEAAATKSESTSTTELESSTSELESSTAELGPAAGRGADWRRG
jgi:hypothetical protein